MWCVPACLLNLWESEKCLCECAEVTAWVYDCAVPCSVYLSDKTRPLLYNYLCMFIINLYATALNDLKAFSPIPQVVFHILVLTIIISCSYSLSSDRNTNTCTHVIPAAYYLFMYRKFSPTWCLSCYICYCSNSPTYFLSEIHQFCTLTCTVCRIVVQGSMHGGFCSWCLGMTI